MKKKVIYVSFIRLTDKVSRDWYIDYLREKEVAVEYWDVVSLVREEYSQQGSKTTDYLRALRTFDEFEARILRPENRDALYIMLIAYEGRFSRIFRLLSKYHCRMLFFSWGAVPVAHASLLRRVLSGLDKPFRSAKIVAGMAKASALRRLNLVKPFEIVFAAGNVLLAQHQYAVKVVPINLFDYDHYVQASFRVDRLIQGRYAVFLDINLPSHSDHAFFGFAPINAVAYYRSLNSFFHLLEETYGTRIVIAAYPTSDYGDELFEGREMHRGLTAELVKDADFVLTHASTATSYPVLNYKPIIFIYTNEQLSIGKKTFIKELQSLADYLEAPIYNVDEIVRGDQVDINRMNRSRYEDYRYSFLTTRESEHTSTREIFWQEIDTLMSDEQKRQP